MSIISEIKKKKHRVFRRVYFKKRLTTGEYDTSWTQIPNEYISNWGQIQMSVDDIIPFYYRYSGMTIEVINNDGYFSNIDAPASLFWGCLTRYKTLVKIEAGYNTGGVELPTNSTLFLGLLGEDMKYQEDNKIMFQMKHISSIFEDFPADRITGLGATQTASDIIAKIRDFQDAGATKIFQKYITMGAWNIQTTTTNYNLATSTSLQNMTCWELMQKLAGAENFVVFVDATGSLYFRDRTVNTTTALYHFSGIGDTDKTYGHNILKKISIDEGLRKVYNRIKIKINSDDTVTSYFIRNQTWQWGDSSSSFRFGVREFSYENYWLVSATASVIADTIFTEYSEPKKEVELETKFVPQLNLLDRVSLTYKTKTLTGGDRWGYFNWGQGIWGGSIGYNINLNDLDYKLINIQHNLNEFKSQCLLREI